MTVRHALLAALLLSGVCTAATAATDAGDARPRWVGNDECRINLCDADYIDVDHRTFSVFREGEDQAAAVAQVSESADAAIDAELARLGWVKLYRSGTAAPEQG